ncbi:MAG TPA: fluoride efflux transporter CrcB [Steroidobacteraceae bacterium]|jgi:CrcB protein
MATLPLASVFVGAGLGACLRWWLGLRLNALLPTLPLGTLAANLIGGFIIGVAVAVFALRTELPPEARLFVITGLLGGLTTFSTFSSEVVGLLSQAQFGWAGVEIGTHMLGSFAATAIGMVMTRWLLTPAIGT